METKRHGRPFGTILEPAPVSILDVKIYTYDKTNRPR